LAATRLGGRRVAGTGFGKVPRARRSWSPPVATRTHQRLEEAEQRVRPLQLRRVGRCRDARRSAPRPRPGRGRAAPRNATPAPTSVPPRAPAASAPSRRHAAGEGAPTSTTRACTGSARSGEPARARDDPGLEHRVAHRDLVRRYSRSAPRRARRSAGSARSSFISRVAP